MIVGEMKPSICTTILSPLRVTLTSAVAVWLVPDKSAVSGVGAKLYDVNPIDLWLVQVFILLAFAEPVPVLDPGLGGEFHT